MPTADINDQITDGSDDIGTSDDRDALWQALGRLAARQRAVVVLRYHEDMSDADVAGALGCSVGTVKSQAARALSRLRVDSQDSFVQMLHDLGDVEAPPTDGRLDVIHHKITRVRIRRTLTAAVAVIAIVAAGIAVASLRSAPPAVPADVPKSYPAPPGGWPTEASRQRAAGRLRREPARCFVRNYWSSRVATTTRTEPAAVRPSDGRCT